MPRSFLDLLPLETRNQIFRYVLSSPTGCISLSRTSYHFKPTRYKILALDENGCKVIDLSFLRTCRQIYIECKDLVWKYNTLDLVSFMYETYRDDRRLLEDLPENIWLHATAVELDYDFLRDGSLPQTNERQWSLQRTALEHLSKWPKLESVTLNIRNQYDSNSLCMSYDRLSGLLDTRRAAIKYIDDPIFARKSYYYNWVDILRDSSDPAGPSSLSHVKRTMVINMEPPTFDEYGCTTRKFKAWKGNPDELLEEFKEAWDCRLIVDGIPRYEGDYPSTVFLRTEDRRMEDGGWEEVFYYEADLAMSGAAVRHSIKSQRDTKEILDEMSESKDFCSWVIRDWEAWRNDPEYGDISTTYIDRPEIKA